MSVSVAENQKLSEEIVSQIRAGEEVIELNSKVLSFLRIKIWDVYDDEEKFTLRLQFQGITGTIEQGYLLQPFPEGVNKNTWGLWSLQGYVAVSKSRLDGDVVSSLSKYAAWTEAGTKDESTRPKLWLEVDESSIVQLLWYVRTDKKSGEEEITFKGWAHQGLIWKGKGIGVAEAIEFDLIPRKGASTIPTRPMPPAPQANPPKGRGGAPTPARELTTTGRAPSISPDEEFTPWS